MNFVWQGHDSKRKFGVSLKRNDDFRTETAKKKIRFCVLQSRSPRLIFDDCVNLLCQWNGTCNMLFVQLIQKVNLGNTTFISYCVNMFIHGHRQILSYIKLGRHVFSHFSRPQSSRQFLADAASQRSVAPPHKTIGPFIPNFVHGMIFFCGKATGRHLFKWRQDESSCWVPATMTRLRLPQRACLYL